MLSLLTLPERMLAFTGRADGLIIGTFARLTFAAVLLVYFWSSALTKLSDGLFGFLSPSVGAYSQIFPVQLEAVGYDISQLGIWSYLVVLIGMWAEFVLPLLIIIGLFTRLAAIAMLGFVTVQTLTDLYGHGLASDQSTVGHWFDKIPDSAIADQRLLWVFLLVTLVIKGAGPLSLDRLFMRRYHRKIQTTIL